MCASGVSYYIVVLVCIGRVGGPKYHRKIFLKIGFETKKYHFAYF